MHRPLLVVGTPGRLAELSRAGALLTHHTGACWSMTHASCTAPSLCGRADQWRLYDCTGCVALLSLPTAQGSPVWAGCKGAAF